MTDQELIEFEEFNRLFLEYLEFNRKFLEAIDATSEL